MLEKEFGNELCASPFVTVSGLKIGQLFDKDAPINKTLQIYVRLEDTEPSTMAAYMIKYRNFIEQNDFYFTYYSYDFSDGRSHICIIVPTEYINDELYELIKKTQGNINEKGSYYESGGFNYYDYAYRGK